MGFTNAVLWWSVDKADFIICVPVFPKVHVRLV